LVFCVRGYTSREGLPRYRGSPPFHPEGLSGDCSSLAVGLKAELSSHQHSIPPQWFTFVMVHVDGSQ